MPLDAEVISRETRNRFNRAGAGREPFVQRGGDPEFVGDELLYAIKAHIARHPRSQQVEIGPSEIGHPCARRIGYKLLDHPTANNTVDWKPTIGVAVHAWLEQAIAAENDDLGVDRYLTENTLYVGTINGRPVFGHYDVYDRTTAGVIDWKVVGPTQLKSYRANGPGEQYRVQGHTYGKGWRLRGFPVDWVGIMFLPRNGELDEAVFWHEPYDESIVDAAFKRAEGIDLAVKAAGVKALEKLGTADAYCTRCPWFKNKSTDLSQGCPGDPGLQLPAPDQPALTLIS